MATGRQLWNPYPRHRISDSPSVYKNMKLAVETHWEYVLLAAVVAFIVLCTIVSLILKDLYRRQ